jgi:hypothetical protein
LQGVAAEKYIAIAAASATFIQLGREQVLQAI